MIDVNAKSPEAAFIVAGDFNHSNLKTVLPKFHQYVSCPTRWDKILDHVYTNMAEAYETLPLPHVEQFDYLSLFLLPKYTPLIKHVNMCTLKVWPEGQILSNITGSRYMDWSVFGCSGHLGLYLDYINSNINSVTTLKQITTLQSEAQKP